MIWLIGGAFVTGGMVGAWITIQAVCSALEAGKLDEVIRRVQAGTTPRQLARRWKR